MSYKQYQSHKVVLATTILSITSIAAQAATEAGDGVPATPAVSASFSYQLADQVEPLVVPIDDPMIARYQPVVGDYLVIYPDGYRAFSPKQSFEDGYSEYPSAPQPLLAEGIATDPSLGQADNRRPETVIMSSLDSIANSLGRIADVQGAMLEQARR